MAGYWYQPLSYINIAEMYLANPYLWDAIIYLMIFLGLAQFVFVKAYHNKLTGKRPGKVVAIGVALALTFGMVMAEYYSGFTLAGAPFGGMIGAMVIFIIFTFLLYEMFQGMIGMNRLCALSLAFIITYPMINGVFNNPWQSMYTQYGLLQSFIFLVHFIAIISLGICVAKGVGELWGKGVGGGKKGPSGDPGPIGPIGPKGKGGNKGDPGEPEPQPVPLPHDVIDKMHSFVRYQGDLQKQYLQWDTLLREFLIAHHAKATGKLSDQEYNDALLPFQRSSIEMGKTITTLKDIADEIEHHPRFDDVDDQTAQPFIKANSSYLQLAKMIDSEWMKFNQAFNQASTIRGGRNRP